MRCAVLGSPIAHSLSPVLHRAAYDKLGLSDWTYDAFEVGETGLAAFLDETATAEDPSEWRGLSLTMPLKQVAIGLCDEVTPVARQVGAVNTVVFEDGRRIGTNTDVPGLVAALRERGVDRVRSAVLAGVGATARSSLAALRALGVRQTTAIARDPARAGYLSELAIELGVGLEVLPWTASLPSVDLVVSTVPADAAAGIADNLAAAANVVFDVVYDPWPTPLAATAARLGRTVVNGLDLLVHQAALQVELMTGCTPAPVEAMHAAGVAALAERQSRG